MRSGFEFPNTTSKIIPGSINFNHHRPHIGNDTRYDINQPMMASGVGGSDYIRCGRPTVLFASVCGIIPAEN